MKRMHSEKQLEKISQEAISEKVETKEIELTGTKPVEIKTNNGDLIVKPSSAKKVILNLSDGGGTYNDSLNIFLNGGNEQLQVFPTDSNMAIGCDGGDPESPLLVLANADGYVWILALQTADITNVSSFVGATAGAQLTKIRSIEGTGTAPIQLGQPGIGAGISMNGSGAITIEGNGITIDQDADGNDTLLVMPYLPTSDPAVKGALWNDNGVLKISAGE